MRQAAKTDQNHQEIVNEARKVGAKVLDVSQLKNCFDLLIGYEGKWIAAEVKDGAKFPKYFWELDQTQKDEYLEKTLTEGEVKFKTASMSRELPYKIIYNKESLFKAIGKK